MSKKREIIFHFNKGHLSDSKIPMWVIKYKGKSFYVDHLDVSKNVGFSTKETPDNKSTKGSMKFKGTLILYEEDGKQMALIK